MFEIWKSGQLQIIQGFENFKLGVVDMQMSTQIPFKEGLAPAIASGVHRELSAASPFVRDCLSCRATLHRRACLSAPPSSNNWTKQMLKANHLDFFLFLFFFNVYKVIQKELWHGIFSYAFIAKQIHLKAFCSRTWFSKCSHWISNIIIRCKLIKLVSASLHLLSQRLWW